MNAILLPHERRRTTGMCTTLMQYTVSSTKRASRTFKIGLATIFIICCFVSLMFKIKEYDQFLALRVLETSQGDFDVIWTPTTNANNLKSLNEYITQQNY